MWRYPMDKDDSHDENGAVTLPKIKPDTHLTLLFDTTDGDALVEAIKDYVGKDAVDGWDRKYRMTSRCSHRGFTIQASPKLRGVRFARIELYRPKASKRGFNFAEHVADLLGALVLPFAAARDLWVSRVDVAIDYALPLHAFHFVSRYTRECEVYYRSGCLTGIKIGSRRSPVTIRIYDKRRELHEVHRIQLAGTEPRTRYEVQVKPASLRLTRLHRLGDPLVHQPFFNIDGVDLKPPYRDYIDMARNVGLGVVSASLPPATRAELVKRLEEAETVGAYLAPRMAFRQLWPNAAKRFLRDIGVR